MDPAKKKTALRAIENGIYLVGCGDGDALNMFMGSWISQCSFEPPLVMMGLKKDTQHHGYIKKRGAFSVNVLKPDQQDVAKSFFKHQEADGDTIGGEPFATADVAGQRVPVLKNAPSWFACKVWRWVDGGDHDIVIGEVVDAGGSAEGDFNCLSEASTGWNYGG